MAIGTVLLAHLAPPLQPSAPPSPAATIERDIGCAEWTDGCRICMRTPDGPSCSTAGFACVKETLRCTRRTDRRAQAGAGVFGS